MTKQSNKMSYEKIYCAIHIGTNLLIVGYNQSQKWKFRVVNKEGEIVKEDDNFNTPEKAKQIASDWIKNNL